MKKFLSVIGVAVFTLAGASAEPLITWNFNGQSDYGTSPYNATGTGVAGVLSRGAGVGSSSSGSIAANAWGGTSFTASSYASAVLAEEYFTFTLTAAPGNTMSIAGIDAYALRWSSTAPQSAQWEFSLNGDTFTPIGSAFTIHGGGSASQAAQGAIDLTSYDLVDIDSITFRLVVWGATNTLGNLYFDGRTGSRPSAFTIQGTSAPIPEPSTWLLLGAGVAIVVIFCRRKKGIAPAILTPNS